jgi:nucleoside-diphosphate-sugar epimerase
VREALKGCSHVVNATRGEADVMLAGLDHLLEESLALGVERFVHLSSVSAWGERAPGTFLRETDPPSPILSGYGRTKLEQDRRVEAASRRGLACLSLAPPYISGAYSPFVLSVVNALRARTLGLIDHGELPCSLVDVQNLAQAIEAALLCEIGDGRRLFVTDGEARSWRNLAVRLAPLGESQPFPSSVTREEARRLAADPKPRASLSGSLRSVATILAGAEARRILAADPLLGPLYRGVAAAVPERARRLLRGAAPSAPPAPASASAGSPAFDRHLLGVQLRAVRHSCEAARATLGWKPALDFDASMDATEAWYRVTHGFGTPSWKALLEL